MKKSTIRRLILLVAVITVSTIFSGFAAGDMTEDQIFIQNILEKRAVIMQQAIFTVHNSADGVADIEDIYDAFHALADMETYPILSQDCNAISLSAGTDIDKVINLEVTSAEMTSQSRNTVFYQVDVTWYMSGNTGHYETSCRYKIMTVTDKNTVKLAQMQLIS
ncbi:MAG: hypothetical protein IKV96_04155 [Firmicutes bacterium]|nr:hypothetical protein [Bacillota bacterium]